MRVCIVAHRNFMHFATLKASGSFRRPFSLCFEPSAGPVRTCLDCCGLHVGGGGCSLSAVLGGCRGGSVAILVQVKPFWFESTMVSLGCYIRGAAYVRSPEAPYGARPAAMAEVVLGGNIRCYEIHVFDCNLMGYEDIVQFFAQGTFKHPRLLPEFERG